MGKLRIMLATLVLVLAVLACGCGGPQTVEVEVTRIVPQTVEVTRVALQTVEVTKVVPQTVEVTRVVPQTVEVTRVVPRTVEVTRLVQVAVTATPRPATPTPKPTNTPVPTDTPESMSAFQKWTTAQAIEAFKAVGLEAEEVRPMTQDDYGLAPMRAVEAMRFLIPSLCEDCGGRLFSCETQEDVDAMREYYESLSEVSAMFFSWVFVRDNVLVQINGDLPEEQARQYEAALSAMGR